MKSYKLIALSALVIALSHGCTTQPVKETPEQKPSYPVSGWGSGRDLMAYDALVLYGRDLIASKPTDIYEWCPSYTPAKAIRFYVALASALTKFESNWKSSVTYTEDFADVKGKPVISRGLAQISIESANSYGCGITDAKQLHDDKTNLECLVRIWNRWIPKDGVIQGGKPKAWLGASRYHSPFRKPERIASMKQQLKGVCQ